MSNRDLSDFEEHIERIPESGCWVWTGGCYNAGYGNYRQQYAHRVSYKIYKGNIPDDMHVLHTCDIPACVNPNHLFLGTNLDNIHDRMIKGRSKGGHKPKKFCKHGHEFTPENTRIEKNGDRNCKACIIYRNLMRGIK